MPPTPSSPARSVTSIERTFTASATDACSSAEIERMNSASTTASTSPADEPLFVTTLSVLGSGGHGRVIKAEVPGMGVIALKELLNGNPQSRRELEVAARLQHHPHPGIVQFYEAMCTEAAPYLPLELCDGDLFDSFASRGLLSEADAACMLRTVASAIQHLHSIGIYHGDIKPENILLKDGVAKLADFGCARFERTSSIPAPSGIYDAPEAIDALHAVLARRTKSTIRDPVPYDSAASEVWSLGITIIAAISGFMPWEAAHTSDAYYSRWLAHFAHFQSGSRVADPHHGLLFHNVVPSPALMQLLTGMLHPDVIMRFTVEEVLAHPWVAQADAAATVSVCQ